VTVADVREALAPGVDTFGAIDPSTPLLPGEKPQGIIQQLGGLETFWMNQDRSFMDPEVRAWFLLVLDGWRRVQTDELTTRTVDVDGEGNVVPDGTGVGQRIIYGVTGTRMFTLQIRCESMAQDNNSISLGYCETLMTAIDSQRGRDLFKAAGLSFIDFLPNGIINVDEPADQRERSHAIFEADFYAGICVEEEPSNLWIQKALASADYGDGAGVPPAWLNHLIDGNAAQP